MASIVAQGEGRILNVDCPGSRKNEMYTHTAKTKNIETHRKRLEPKQSKSRGRILNFDCPGRKHMRKHRHIHTAEKFSEPIPKRHSEDFETSSPKMLFREFITTKLFPSSALPVTVRLLVVVGSLGA